MLKKFLKEVMVLVVGKQAEDLIDFLDKEKYVNEFLIAKKLGITINQTRNILYKISERGLVSSIRKKDKKKGWYTYFWKIEILKCLEFLRDILLSNIEQISKQIKSRETKRFYVCERCNIEFSEENALTRDFTCNECGDIFSMKDAAKVLRDLGRNLEKLKNELKMVEIEIEKEEQKIQKKKERELKKLAKSKQKKKTKKIVKKAVKPKKKTKKKVTKKKPSKKKQLAKKIKKNIKKRKPVQKTNRKKVIKKKAGKKKTKKGKSKK